MNKSTRLKRMQKRILEDYIRLNCVFVLSLQFSLKKKMSRFFYSMSNFQRVHMFRKTINHNFLFLSRFFSIGLTHFFKRDSGLLLLHSFRSSTWVLNPQVNYFQHVLDISLSWLIILQNTYIHLGKPRQKYRRKLDALSER